MSCTRFEREGLGALERGEPLDPHFASCPDCLAARAGYARLSAAIGSLAADAEPPPGWQARVRLRLEERQARRSARWWWLALPAAAGLAAAIFLPTLRPERRPALEVRVTEGGVPRRGAAAHPGDRLEVSAQLAGARFAELRIYRNDRGPLLACSGAPPCRRQGDSLEALFVLPSAGEYQVLLLSSARPLPAASTGELDGDARQAAAAGARVELEDLFEVR